MIDIPDAILPKNKENEIICPKCKAIAHNCTCPVKENPAPKRMHISPHIRIEKKGRKGKIVTLIDNLPINEIFLHELTKSLKIKTGSGGTYYTKSNTGIIEIQGDQRKSIEAHFLRNPVFC